MKLPSIPYLGAAFLEVWRRFPLVMLAATAGAIALMVLIEHNFVHDVEVKYSQIALTCSLGLSTFLCAALVIEKWKLKMPAAIIPHLVAAGLVAFYYASLHWNDFDNDNTVLRFIALNLAAHLGVAFIPYLDKASSVEDFWEYNKQLFGNFVVGAFYSGVIFAGLSIAILAVNELFHLDISEKIYGHLFILIAGIFNTTYFLSHFPKEFNFTTEPTDNQAIETPPSPYTTSFKNLTKFILIPIAIIYFLILYAFSTKILVTWELPEGWVGKLVLGFSVAGIFTYLLNYMLVKYDDSQLVKGYRRWFFFILLPMVALLFVAIGRRISDYGVTEARYVVATSGIWLLLMSLYFIASKKDNIKFIPISLAFFAVATVVGPFSAFQASQRSQTSRLLAIFEKNKMLKDGKLIPAADTLEQAEAEQVRSGIEYLSRNDYFEKMAPMFGLPKDSVPDWQATDLLISQLGITNAKPAGKQCYIDFKERNQREMAVAGYELVYQVYAYEQSKPAADFTGFAVSESGMSLQYYVQGVAQDSFDFQPFIQKLKDQGVECSSSEQPDSLSYFRTSGAGMEAVFHATNFSYYEGDKPTLREFNGQVLLRKKQ
ncbi:MAG: DUF4153 domain-containing protein [Saprospiraceae bacterium]|nr:DUF4153 domain-containing protein [Saprospiraceae bacterium]